VPALEDPGFGAAHQAGWRLTSSLRLAVVLLAASDAIFRKYTPSKSRAGADDNTPSRTTIEQSVVRIYKKK